MKSHKWKKNKFLCVCVFHLPQQNVNMISLSWSLACISVNVMSEKGGAIYIRLGAWFPHHKSNVTVIYFFEILSTYVHIFFQLWLCKYLDISVTCVYILSSSRQLLKESCHAPSPGSGLAWSRSCYVCSQGSTRSLAKGSWHYDPSSW